MRNAFSPLRRFAGARASCLRGTRNSSGSQSAKLGKIRIMCKKGRSPYGPANSPEYHKNWLRANRKLHNAQAQAWRKRNPRKAKDSHLRCRHGIGIADFDRLLAAQGGKCAICRTRKARDVDHSHVSGKVRGLLCHGCNVGLGFFRERSESLLRAVDYLEAYHD